MFQKKRIKIGFFTFYPKKYQIQIQKSKIKKEEEEERLLTESVARKVEKERSAEYTCKGIENGDGTPKKITRKSRGI